MLSRAGARANSRSATSTNANFRNRQYRAVRSKVPQPHPFPTHGSFPRAPDGTDHRFRGEKKKEYAHTAKLYGSSDPPERRYQLRSARARSARNVRWHARLRRVFAAARVNFERLFRRRQARVVQVTRDVHRRDMPRR